MMVSAQRGRKQKIRVATASRLPTQTGYFLIEALMSVVIVSIMIASLMDGYSKIRQYNVQGQTQLQAAAMGQECIDQLRAQDYSTTLAPNIGAHNATVIGAYPTNDALFPNPLFRDTAMTYYKNGSVDDTNNIIHVQNNAVSVILAPINGGNAIQATVTVSWTDTRGNHTYIVQTQLTDKGLNG